MFNELDIIIKLDSSWWGDGDNNAFSTTSEGSKRWFRWESLIECRVNKSELKSECTWGEEFESVFFNDKGVSKSKECWLVVNVEHGHNITGGIIIPEPYLTRSYNEGCSNETSGFEDHDL